MNHWVKVMHPLEKQFKVAIKHLLPNITHSRDYLIIGFRWQKNKNYTSELKRKNQLINKNPDDQELRNIQIDHLLLFICC